MKKNKVAIILIAICLIVVAVLAVIHEKSRPVIPKHSILVEYNNKSAHIDISKLTLTEVNGSIVNGKGEEKAISGNGILLRDALKAYEKSDFNLVKVIADDEYSAELEKSELYDADQAYLLIDGTEARLYVFGDKNSKRNVSNVVRIVLE